MRQFHAQRFATGIPQICKAFNDVAITRLFYFRGFLGLLVTWNLRSSRETQPGKA